MFTKRVGFIRDLERDISVLDKKQKREISKLNSDIENEIKKTLRKYHPGCIVDIRRLELKDFHTNPRKREPVKVQINSFNGKFLSKTGKWMETNPDDWDYIESDNRIPADKMLEICAELSENLDVLIDFYRVSND